MFFWTLCSMHLPTKDVLCMKRVNCDQVCTLCGLANESTIHLFANCSFACDYWRELDATWQLSYVDSAHSWFEEMWDVLPKHMLEKVVMVCWSMWENRNSKCWHDKCMPPRAVVRYALAFGDHWKMVNHAANGTGLITSGAGQSSVTWQSLPPGYLKLNLDVGMDVHRRRMGFGWVCHDEMGLMKGVHMTNMRGLYSVREAEIMGAREALSWLKQKG